MFGRILINKNKPTKYTFLLALAVFLLVTAIGFIKFNFFDDDIYISGDSVTIEDMVGSWIEPIPGQKDKYQGFTLHDDSTAESINMNTLLIQKWRLDKGYLVLTEKSIGNGSSSIGDERYKIDVVGKKKLRLIRGSYSFEYERKK